MVPVVDLTRRLQLLQPDFIAAVERVTKSGHLLLGPETEAFEAEFAAWTGHRHVVAVSSGAAALQLALSCVGVGAGDEVIVPAFTAVPTAAAVCALGATPVFVDVEADTATLDPRLIGFAVTDLTKAVVPVHLYGRPSALTDGSLVHLGVATVEDAAQAHGAVRAPRPSAAVAYSFYPTKNLGGIGDGGAVCTDDDALADHVRRLRSHAMSGQYVHLEVSQNFRMSEIEAAWLRIALTRLDDGNARRRTIVATYRAAAPSLAWHADHPDHVHHLCVFRSDDRNVTRAVLEDAGIGTLVHYPLALTQQPAYSHFTRDECPVAGRWAAQCISVPCFPDLTDDEVALVASALTALEAQQP